MARISLALAVALGLAVSVVPADVSLAASDGLTINEIDYDQESTDSAEFVEIYNGGAESVDLTGLELQLVNGTGGGASVYATIALTGMIAGGDFFVVCANMATTPNCDLDGGADTNLIQNGAPDAVALTQSDGTIIDTVSYEGDTGAPYTEGAGAGTDDPAIAFAGLSRFPDGNDTDDNSADFSLACITPGTANASDADGCADPNQPPGNGDGDPTACLFINEFHYDNTGTDSGEAIEVAGTPGSLDGYSLVLYNGSNGAAYNTTSLTGTIGDQQNGHGTAVFNYPVNGIQNGAPDGIALVDPDGAVLQFLSYEGVFLAVGGPADGRWSRDIGVAEDSATPADQSLQLTGPNNSDFTWVGPFMSSFGSPNADQTFGGTCPTPEAPPPPPPAPKLEIYEVQGPGMSSEYEGQRVTIDGIVVGDFQGNEVVGEQLGGFHLQEATGDGDASTSDGIFVFAPDARELEVGEYVEVTGTVTEFFNLTEITNVTAISPPESTPPPEEAGPITPTSVTLPVSSEDDWEKYEGMLISFGNQQLYISEFFNFDRTGEIVLTTERQFQGTQVAEPGAEAIAIAEANALHRVTLDDGRFSQNPDPARHPNGGEFTLTNTFRGGDSLEQVTGVVHESRPYASDFVSIEYRLHPTMGAEYTEINERPTSPDDVGGDLKVATFNVLNFFTHLNNPSTGADDICGPTANLECRGANTEEELQRQLDKLVAGIIALDADIVGIQEIENDIHDEEIDDSPAHDAVLTLIDALNEADEEWTWAWVGPANHYNDYPVRNDIIYRTESVMPVGSPVALEHEAFDSTRPGSAEPIGRPPLAQTFTGLVDRGSRQPFTVVVNHFKSKGSSCANIGDPDAGDGQGNCNLTRVAQANALLDFIDVLDDDSSGVLAIGDFNSYAMEDPIETLEDAGLTDLVKSASGTEAYSYLFDGQLGTLDYILSTRSMLNWVQGVTVFHINADEPDILDYDTSFKRPAQDALYEPLPYRVSDHDPVIVGLSLGGTRGG